MASAARSFHHICLRAPVRGHTYSCSFSMFLFYRAFGNGSLYRLVNLWISLCQKMKTVCQAYFYIGLQMRCRRSVPGRVMSFSEPSIGTHTERSSMEGADFFHAALVYLISSVYRAGMPDMDCLSLLTCLPGSNSSGSVPWRLPRPSHRACLPSPVRRT